MKVKIVCILLHYLLSCFKHLCKNFKLLVLILTRFFHLRIHLLLVHFVHDDDLRLYWAKINEIKHFNLWPIRSTWDSRHQNGRTHFCEFSNKSDFDRHSSLVSTFRAMRFLSSLFSTDLFTQFDEATGFYTLCHKRAPDLAWFRKY